MDAGRFQRLDEAARESDRDTVLDPGTATAARPELQQPELDANVAFQVVQQHPARLVVARVRGRVDVAGALPMLQRDLPLPARAVGNGARVGRYVVEREVGLQRQRAVVAQPLAPVFVTGLERLFDEQAAKAGAVEEQVAVDALARLHHHRFDEARLRILRDAGDLALDALDALGLAALAQVAGIQRGVEVIGVVDPRFFRREELVRPGGLVLEAVVAQLVAEAGGPRGEPEIVEIAEPRAPADDAEGMDVAVAAAGPVLERDAQLDGAARDAQELALVQVENLVERADRGEGGFTDADRADLLRLDQRDVDQRAQLLGQRRRRAPARRAAAGDHDLPDLLCRQSTAPVGFAMPRSTGQ